MVCLGNICRSPVAEGIMRSKIEKYNLNAIVDSAGTSNYHIGQNPDSRSQANAIKNGINIATLQGRQFETTDFDSFDFIYVMDRQNLKDVLSKSKLDSHKQKVKLILDELNRPIRNEVPDPYFGGEDGFQEVFQLLEDACDIVAQKLLIKTQSK